MSLGSDDNILTYTKTNGLTIKAKSFVLSDSSDNPKTKLSSTDGIIAKKGIIGGWTLTNEVLYTQASNGADGSGNGFMAGTTVETNPIFYAGYSKAVEKDITGLEPKEWPTLKYQNWVTNGVVKCMITQGGEFYAWGGINLGGGKFVYDVKNKRLRMNGNIQLEDSTMKSKLFIGDSGTKVSIWGTSMYNASNAYAICMRDTIDDEKRQFNIAAVREEGSIYKNKGFNAGITLLHSSNENGSISICAGPENSLSTYGMRSQIYLQAGVIPSRTGIAMGYNATLRLTSGYNNPNYSDIDMYAMKLGLRAGSPGNGTTSYIYINHDNGIIIGASAITLRGQVTYDTDGSDRRLKYDIESFPDQYDKFYDKLKPVRYKYHHENIEQYHTGFIAQDIEQSLAETGLSTLDLGATFKTRSPLAETIGEEEIWAMHRDELVSLNTWQIQKLKARIEALEQEIKELTK